MLVVLGSGWYVLIPSACPVISTGKLVDQGFWSSKLGFGPLNTPL